MVRLKRGIEDVGLLLRLLLARGSDEAELVTEFNSLLVNVLQAIHDRPVYLTLLCVG